MTVKVNPWDQQRGETSQAFGAFRAFLELGTGRSYVDAYRAASGRADAVQVPGCWNRWIAAHQWEDRARAWDRQVMQQVDHGLFRAAQSRGERMALGLDQALEEAMAGALRSIEQGQRFLAMPTTETEVVDDQGRKVIVKPASARDQRFGALMISIGLELAVKARDLALAQTRDGEKPEAEVGEVSLAMDRAARELDAWRSEQRKAVLAIPAESPGGPTPDGSPAPAGV